ncbi:hypothetical protein BDB01DRAFT_769721 [Pilobolus umbonatus]|nr:hypothetical protein BDB01DRAFT_769721 [Pilobolus umbonatus]
MTLQYEWFEVANPNFSQSFYANPFTGDCTWSKPQEEDRIKYSNPEGDWWELWDEKHNLPYYYNTRANTSNWTQPTDANVTSLTQIKPSEEFVNKMSALATHTMEPLTLFPTVNNINIPHAKRLSRSLDIPNEHLSTLLDNNIPKRHHSRSVSDSITNTKLLNDPYSIPVSDISSLSPSSTHHSHLNSPSLVENSLSTSILFNFGLCTKRSNVSSRNHSLSSIKKAFSTETHRSKKGIHFPQFSNFTRAAKVSSNAINPTKQLSSRTSTLSQIGTPVNNPEAAQAMHPLNQLDYSSTDSDSVRKPQLPMSLKQEINCFAIDGFAQKYFSTHKRGLFRRRVPVTEMLKWTKDSLRQPLIMMNKELYKDALRCFKLIQMIMGDRSRPKHGNEIEDIQALLTCGITIGQMRDEIYVQVCKQLNENPHDASIHKGWEILCIISITFPASKNLESYLTDFVAQHHHMIDNQVSIMSQHVSTKLKRICARGAKGKVLTAAEINRAKEAPFKPSVFGESLEFIMSLQTDKQLFIPQIVPFLANTIRETHGELSEGIFRVSGDADAVTDLRVRIENEQYNATGITDPNIPASLLKYWLRDLADPIIVTEYYDDCIKYAEDPEKAIDIINRLPDTNRRIALFLISFLQEFTDPSIIKHTLMNVNNLAMVFAPNFLRCPSESLTTVFENSKYEQAFLRTLINEMVVDPDTCLYSDDPDKVKGACRN